MPSLEQSHNTATHKEHTNTHFSHTSLGNLQAAGRTPAGSQVSETVREYSHELNPRGEKSRELRVQSEGPNTKSSVRFSPSAQVGLQAARSKAKGPRAPPPRNVPPPSDTASLLSFFRLSPHPPLPSLTSPSPFPERGYRRHLSHFPPPPSVRYHFPPSPHPSEWVLHSELIARLG